jgi:enoyl-CoA hydratase/carnithine racemase
MDKVLYEKRDRIAYITLNRPETLSRLPGSDHANWLI